MSELENDADLRSFLQELEATVDHAIVRVPRRVTLKHELASVVKLLEKKGNPVVVFEDVDGLGIPVVSGLFATKQRISLSLGTTPNHAVEAFLDRIGRSIEPIDVDGAPIHDQKSVGDDVDLARLPIPVHVPKEAGPYLTAAVCLVRDPESGAHNAGIYRTMVHSKNRVTISVDPGHDLGKVIEWGRNNAVDVDCAMVIGYHPTLAVASQAKTPIHVDAFALTGSLLGRPVLTTRGVTVNIDVPANAEIVLEGKILCTEREREGPFGEFSYYYGSSRAAVCEITAITQRHAPLFLDIHSTHPDHRCLWIFPAREARLLELLRAAISGVKAVHIPLDGAGMVAYISLVKQHDGDARRALMMALSSDIFIKHAVVFDPDIDIFDPGQVLWALAVRFQADSDMMVIPGARGFAEDPSSYSRIDRHAQKGLTTKSGLDTTSPLERPYPERADLLPDEYAGINVEDYISGNVVNTDGRDSGAREVREEASGNVKRRSD